ncbi:phosphatidylinositol-4,5-diphosphate 3-kinase [Pelomyxa schiedti]|nr:phosphatidylinositol-4,5-diphosphate 3-kinase [Pelomyxa schiedti]
MASAPSLHDYHTYSPSFVTTCIVCRGWVYPYFSNALICESCGIVCHKACKETSDAKLHRCLRRNTQDTMAADRPAQTVTFAHSGVIKEGRLRKNYNNVWRDCFVIYKEDNCVYVFEYFLSLVLGTLTFLCSYVDERGICYTQPIECISLEGVGPICPIQSFDNTTLNQFAIALPTNLTGLPHTFEAASFDDMQNWVHTLTNIKKKPTYQFEESMVWVDSDETKCFSSWGSLAVSRSEINVVDFAALARIVDALPINLPPYVVNMDDECRTFIVKAQDCLMRRIQHNVVALTNEPVPVTFPRTFYANFWKEGNTTPLLIQVEISDSIGDCVSKRVVPHFFPGPNPPAVCLKVTGTTTEFLFNLTLKFSALYYIRRCIENSSRPMFELLDLSSLPRPNQGSIQQFLAKNYQDVGIPVIPQICANAEHVSKRFCCMVSLTGWDKKIWISPSTNIIISGMLCYGSHVIGEVTHTRPVKVHTLSEEALLEFGVELKEIPWETHIIFGVYTLIDPSETLDDTPSGSLPHATSTPVTHGPARRAGSKSPPPMRTSTPGIIFNGTGISKCDPSDTASEAIRPSWTNMALAFGKKVASMFPGLGGNTPRLSLVAKTSFTAFDFSKRLRSGKFELPLITTTGGLLEMKLRVQFPPSPMPIVLFPDVLPAPGSQKIISPSSALVEHLRFLAQQDALVVDTPADKNMLWTNRLWVCTNVGSSLSRILLAADWKSPPSVLKRDLLNMLVLSPKMDPLRVLELLDARFPDSYVQQYASYCLDMMPDREFASVLIQLVQLIKSQIYHWSPLTGILLQRANYCTEIAHSLCWLLHSQLETEDLATSTRFKLTLQAFLAFCRPEIQSEWQNQVVVISGLTNLAKEAQTLCRTKSPAEANTFLQQQLARYNRSIRPFSLPVCPNFVISRIVPDKTKVCDSNALPVLYTFADATDNTSRVLLKLGDDLRMDMLVVQMLDMMNSLWIEAGYDFYIKPYKVQCTGSNAGLIQIVPDATTVSQISQLMAGPSPSAAYAKNAVLAWLNTLPNPNNARERFIRSCAGYSVASYILGLGDRHNDNIMITRSGELFHIDFAYVLGKKTLFIPGVPIPRETTPFVLTPDYVEAMGGEDSPGFNQYKNLCCEAYNILRKHSLKLITLFVSMVSVGIHQLTSFEDVYYLRDALAPELTPVAACARFRQLIDMSLANSLAQFNNYWHIWAHPKKV